MQNVTISYTAPEEVTIQIKSVLINAGAKYVISEDNITDSAPAETERGEVAAEQAA